MNLELQRAIKEKKRLERKQKNLGEIFKRAEEINELNNSIAILIELSKEPINDIKDNILSSLIYSSKNEIELKKNLKKEKKKTNYSKCIINIMIILGATCLFLKIVL